MYRTRVDALSLVAVLFLGFFGFNLIRDAFSLGSDHLSTLGSEAAAPAPSGGEQPDLQSDLVENQVAAVERPTSGLAYVITGQQPAAADPAAQAVPANFEDPGDPNEIVFPYPEFVVTQGVHGAEYNQMAVDIAAGNGAPIHSPINGHVSALYVDEYGNPVLVLDNSRWTIMLYHGKFTVKVGDTVLVGETVVGRESNQGFTVDAFGQICAGRDCGYHSHINVYDKQAGANVDPLQTMKSLKR